MSVIYRRKQDQPPTAVPFRTNQMLRKHAFNGVVCAAWPCPAGPVRPARSGSAVNQGNIPLPTRGGQNYGAHA